MPRIVSVFLPRWPIRRFLAAQTSSTPEPVDPDRPFVLAVTAAGGPRIAALNEAAAAEGLAAGDLVADARAKAGMLQVRDAEPAADAAALDRLALWATRYTPAAAPWDEDNGADGFFLDVTGAAHLFGGESGLLADLAARLNKFGLPARLAVADTPGAAWALSRFQPQDRMPAAGREAEALAALPVEALRLAPDTSVTLRRLGFKRIGALLDQPRAPFAARFRAELLRRLDQAFGRASEPLVFIVPPPVYHSLRYLLEPIAAQTAVVAVATRLMKDLVHALTRDGAGARTLRLSLYRVDGEVQTIEIGLALPSRDAVHVGRLIDLKLDALATAPQEDDIDAGFGFEALGLAVTAAEPLEERQTTFAGEGSGGSERAAVLIDALSQRLGPHSVRRLAPVASHLPERAEATGAAAAVAMPWPDPDAARPRPLLLLPRAEPAQVIAPVPDGPPRQFQWRGVLYHVSCAQGPERIAAEWWRQAAPTRDYYVVEDGAGHRFWLYREGLYGRETAAPRWFVHGLFA
jgi:protein ImuB